MSRKEQIIQKALEIMKERGFSGLTMRDLAKSLGMEAASLYNHIASKDDLLERVCFGIATQLEEGILEVNDVYFNAVERLESAVRSHVNVLTQNLDASFVFVHEWRYLMYVDLASYGFFSVAHAYQVHAFAQVSSIYFHTTTLHLARLNHATVHV
jgi:AcrR family transcriptional regulator